MLHNLAQRKIFQHWKKSHIFTAPLVQCSLQRLATSHISYEPASLILVYTSKETGDQ